MKSFFPDLCHIESRGVRGRPVEVEGVGGQPLALPVLDRAVAEPLSDAGADLLAGQELVGVIVGLDGARQARDELGATGRGPGETKNLFDT